MGRTLYSQGFINLGFEAADLIHDPAGLYPESVYARFAIPGWTAYIGGVPQSDVLSNSLLLSLAYISVQSSASTFGYQPLDGNYSIHLAGQYNPTDAPGATNSAAIGQVGQIPADAQSMTFDGYNLVGMQVMFNGQSLSLLTISNAANFTVYGVDVSADAGQTGQLLFMAPYNGAGEIDDIQFSASVVPEPNMLALFSLGILSLFWWRRRFGSQVAGTGAQLIPNKDAEYPSTTVLAWMLICLFASHVAVAQGTFQNLNFESAFLVGYPPGAGVPITRRMPGWAAGVDGTDKTATVAYDAVSLGGPFIAINDANTGFGFTPIQGSFSACLFSSGGNLPVATSISQPGLVPSGTMSLQAEMVVHGPTPVVMLGGQALNMVPLASFPTYTLYGAGVSAFAGQTATLSFTEPPSPIPGSPSSLVLDDIVVSPEPVPEPGPFFMFTLGALLLRQRVLGLCR